RFSRDWSSDVCSSDLEAGDRAVDQPRIDRLQRFVVEAVGRQAADLEVLQHHVALRRQFAYQALALGLGEVQSQRLLVAVGALERSEERRVVKESRAKV